MRVLSVSVGRRAGEVTVEHLDVIKRSLPTEEGVASV